MAVTAEALMVHLTADMSATAPLSPTLREAFEAVHRRLSYGPTMQPQLPGSGAAKAVNQQQMADN